MSARISRGWLSLLLVAACGRAPSPASSPAAPARELSAEPGGAPAAQQQAAPPPPPPAATAAPATAAPTIDGMTRSGRGPGGDGKKSERKEEGERARGHARDIEEAFAALAQGDDQIMRLTGSSCGDACRALASMERAARTVCDLVTPDERARCDEATSRLRSARKRVRDACGTCGDGVSTDPDAPLR